MAVFFNARKAPHCIGGIIQSAKIELSTDFCRRLLESRLNHSLDNSIRRYTVWRRDKKIARLEQEYRNLMASSPRDLAGLARIISALGKLWNAKIRDEQDERLAGGDGAPGIGQLQRAVCEVVCEEKRKMSKARSREEIHRAFIEGMDKVGRLLNG